MRIYVVHHLLVQARAEPRQGCRVPAYCPVQVGSPRKTCARPPGTGSAALALKPLQGVPLRWWYPCVNETTKAGTGVGSKGAKKKMATI